jgi:hypothetical protein
MEVVSIGLLLWIFRPRKEWPDFFSLGLGGLAQEAQRRGRPEMDLADVINNMVPINVSKINNSFLQGGLLMRPGNKGSFGSTSSFSSFGSMDASDALIIVNPNEYTVSDQETSIQDKEETKNPYKEDEEQFNGIIYIQKQVKMAYREP